MYRIVDNEVVGAKLIHNILIGFPQYSLKYSEMTLRFLDSSYIGILVVALESD